MPRIQRLTIVAIVMVLVSIGAFVSNRSFFEYDEEVVAQQLKTDSEKIKNRLFWHRFWSSPGVEIMPPGSFKTVCSMETPGTEIGKYDCVVIEFTMKGITEKSICRNCGAF